VKFSEKDRELCLKDFSFDVPGELIAQNPQENRDTGRLLICSRDGGFGHNTVQGLEKILPQHSLVILNDTRVFASRVIGRLPTGGKLELFLTEKPEGKPPVCHVLAKPGRKLKPGVVINFSETFRAEVLPFLGGLNRVVFNRAWEEIEPWLKENAYVPLPPYIKREDPVPWNKSIDANWYQTIFAKKLGSVAAPTAALHFSNSLLSRLKEKNIKTEFVTLHVGLGTFLPVRVSNIDSHHMHSEQFKVPKKTFEAIQLQKKKNLPVILVGTTTLRALATTYKLAEKNNVDILKYSDQWLETDLFLYPKTREQKQSIPFADALMTNFHQPCSTLFMLVAALIGLDRAQKMYREAVEKRYRFFTYGDSSFLWL